MSDLTEFRLQTRRWLEQNCPASQRQPFKSSDLVWPGRKQNFPSEEAKLWFEKMRDRGWTCPQFPSEYGGGGLDDESAKILSEEMQRLHCRPPLTDQGISMLGPALIEFGTEEQKALHLPKIVRGELRWCQGYSEPGAGSDLASLQCKAELDGNQLVINGTKIWTSYGVESDCIFCLVRTQQAEIKQNGITFLLIDMQTAGVEVKSIELISGESEFAQVFFDNVSVPINNVVGDLHQGWKVAKALLKHERKMMAELGGNVFSGNMSLSKMAKEYIGSNDNDEIADASVRDAIAQHEMNMRAIELTGYRTHQETLTGTMDRRVPLIMKYLGTSQIKVKDELLVDIMGYHGLGWKDNFFSEQQLKISRELLFNKALTIAGGTNEIQLNIIAKQALNLPQQ